GATYQWGTGSVGSNIIAGATSVSYTTLALTANTTYWVRRVGSSPCSNTTGGVTQLITVNSVPAQPGTISGPGSPLCTPSTHAYSIAAVPGATSYRWQMRSDNSLSYTTVVANGGVTQNISWPEVESTTAQVRVQA